MQICYYNAEEVFKLLTYHGQNLMFLPKFRSKAPVKMVRNLSLSQRRGPWRFWSWLSGLDWLKLASRCLRTLGGRSGQRHQLDKELWGCVLAGWEVVWRRRRGLCQPDFSAWFARHRRGLVRRHLYCWTVDKMIQMTHLQSDRKCLLLKLPPAGLHLYFFDFS